MNPQNGDPTLPLNDSPQINDPEQLDTPAEPSREPRGPWLSGFLIGVAILTALGGFAAVLWAGRGYRWLPLPGITDAGSPDLQGIREKVLGAGAAGLIAGALFLLMQWRWGSSIRRDLDGHALAADSEGGSARVVSLLVVSMLGLFLEVCLIRWHGTEFRAAAYFKNVTLLACFLGLGLGFAIAGRRRSYFPITMGLLAGHVILFGLLSRMGIDSIIRHPQTESGLWFWSVETIEGNGLNARVIGQLAIFYGFFLAIFVTTILIFIPIGQLTGRMMKTLPPVRAYTVNIVGSIAGVLLFTATAYLWLPPVVWFGLAALMAVVLLRKVRGALMLSVPFAIALLVWLGVDWGQVIGSNSLVMQHIYSPYQHLELQPYQVIDRDGRRLARGVGAFANKAYHLRAADLSDEWIAAHGANFPWIVARAAGYNLPYLFCPQAREVLVIGAGAGNDVAAALRNLASELRLDAVEIDPAIYEIGRRHHPEQPYRDPRVTAHVDDARHFVKRTPRHYDLIVFGLVDSHTLLSSMSNVRLDNFVYTAESLAEAKGLLNPNGTIAISFCTKPDHPVSLRIYRMLRELMPDHAPRVFHIGADGGTVFIAGPGAATSPQLPAMVVEAEVTAQMEARDPRQFPPTATDDWPFLYMAGREIPNSYVWLLVMLAVVSIVWIRGISNDRAPLDAHFFFLGAAFLLIEVKGITELALVWGTTWVVNSVVIAVILGLILLANLYVTRIQPRTFVPYYIALGASLLTGYLLRIDSLLAYDWHVAALLSALLLLVPLFFAGVIFASSLKRCNSVPSAFASNLLGAILGGLCEYAAMAWGFRALYLLGLALYAASFICLYYRRTRTA
ncbi:MAG: hypothetical protein KJ749_01980 [Planctomycetes bacterium]|nr:hypothetical protein [Planctomycetota bacterium]